MRIKEILPWTIESPIIQLVQPSPTIPLGHELVSLHTSQSGAQGNAIYALAAQESKKHKRIRQEKQKEFKEKKESNLSCGFISPRIHDSTGNRKKRNSFYDLRTTRSMSIAVERPLTMKPNQIPVARSNSLEATPSQRRRKTCPNFEDILRDLQCESRPSSGAGESTTSRTSETSSGLSSRRERDLERQSSVISGDSVFYDISLDAPEIERSTPYPQPDIPRKSFSEETFDKNRMNLIKQRRNILQRMSSEPRKASSDSNDEGYEEMWSRMYPLEKRRVSQMVDDLLLEIYGDKTTRPVRRRSSIGMLRHDSDSLHEDKAYFTEYTSGSDSFRQSYLQEKGLDELRKMCDVIQADVKRLGGRLVKQLIRRDCLHARRDWHCNWITAYLQANSEKRSEDTKTRFSVVPSPGDSGFTQWQNGMRMVARLPEGIPPQFRKTLWLNLAEKHLASRGVQWQQVEEFCFNEFTNPDDEELGVQIVKDVHRTGCSLFCGVSGKDNQALLKRVLLAYARWNKAVGYCQGFNMLAALILQVMDKSEVDSVKVMIFLIEGVLPESYFANSLRGLSVDMAVFRDLLRIKLPTLSRHFDQLQSDSKDSGTSYEPPLTNVFTMQWFLTLFCNCLPQDTVLRVWDLIFLEGNHVLLCTALAIWSTLSDRILTVESADEFYCIMGVLTREMLEFGLMDANALIKAIVSFNLPELAELREKYLYNITPWTQSVSTVARRGLRLFYSDDDTDTEEDEEKIAIATAYGLFRSPKKKDGGSGVTSPPRALTCPDKEKIAMDISALTKQYRKLRERQKQAHVILTAACGGQSLVGPTTSPAMNHLLMGKFALVNSKGRRLGPPPGSIPPPSQPRSNPNERPNITISGETLHWKDTVDTKRPHQRDSDEEKSPDSSPSKNSSRRASGSSTSTELCDDPQRLSDSETNSLSECYVTPLDRTDPSTPLRSGQPKHHPDDIESCREEAGEEVAAMKGSDVPSAQQAELEVIPKEDSISISPDGEEDKPQQKRKASFRIDPEELRQLDRKLSLKIVEIERRRSSAGIESEDLNSKVLFPFDRDYIQDVERAEMDTPSSIPDDRMCSSDDFVREFEEEIILVPDLITTHKPLGYRMSSLEECDETKANEIADYDEDTQKESFDENEDDLKSYDDEENSDDNDEQERSEQLICTKFNFDELFDRKKIENNEKFMDDSLIEKNMNDSELSERSSYKFLSENTNLLQNDSFANTSNMASLSSVPAQETVSEKLMFSYATGSSNNLNSKIHEILQISVGTNIFPPDKNHLSDGSKTGLESFEAISDNSDSLERGSAKVLVLESGNPFTDSIGLGKISRLSTDQSKTVTVTSASSHSVEQSNNLSEGVVVDTEEKSSLGAQLESTPTNLSDAQKILERKLANLLPKMQSSFDTSLPDVAVVTSREVEINSIREKYANLAQTSLDITTSDVTLSVKLNDPEPCQLPKSLLLNYINTNDSLEGTVDLDLDAGQTILVKEVLPTTTVLSVESESFNPEVLDDASESEKVPNLSKASTNEFAELRKLSQAEMIWQERSQTIGSRKSKEIYIDSVDDKEKEGDKPTTDCISQECLNRPTTSSSNRRGSEVALSLILKENSQILSKIHQQSRRSSEICIDSNYESMTTAVNEENKIQEIINVDEEIMSLNRSILDNLGDTIEAYRSSQTEINNTDTFSSNISGLVLESNKDSTSGELPKTLTEKIELNKSEFTENNLSDEIVLMNQKREDPQTLSNTFSLPKSPEFLKDNDTLPDLCKFDGGMNLKCNDFGESSQNIGQCQTLKTLTSSDIDETLDFDSKIINRTELDSTGFRETSSFSSRASIMSPTKEVDENSPTGNKTMYKKQITHTHEKPSMFLSKFREASEDSSKSTLFTQKDENKPLKSPVQFSADNSSDTNEDILEELRFLNIKPEDILEFSDSSRSTSLPHKPNDSIYSYKTNPTVEKTEFSISPEDQYYDFSKFKPTSLDYSSDSRVSRSPSKKNYREHKAISLDMSSLDKGNSPGTYLSEKQNSFIRSSTLSEDDNSLYMNSYKSHGRLLIEHGELDTYRNIDEENASLRESNSTVRKSFESFEESACDFTKSNRDKVNQLRSEFSSKDISLPEYKESQTREKLLFKYKSEDHERNVSPSHYRFSSASPVRKRLDTLSAEPSSSSYSTINRAKSPSPISFHTSQSQIKKENYSSEQLESSGSDYTSRISKDYRMYSRTESLDVCPSSDRSVGYLRRRADSFETPTADKVSKEKDMTPSSPVKFNPFPVRSSSRQPKELGVKLGLYLPPKSDKSPSKRLT